MYTEYKFLCIHLEMLLFLLLICFFSFLCLVLAHFQAEFLLLLLLSILLLQTTMSFFIKIVIVVFAVAIFCLRTLARTNECSMWCNVYFFSCPSLISNEYCLFVCANMLSNEWINNWEKTESDNNKKLEEKLMLLTVHYDH